MDVNSPAATARLQLPAIAVGTLIVVSLACVAAVRWSGMSISEPDAPIAMVRLLTFTDRPDGSIDVVDAQTHRLVETVVGQSGFVRGTLRGLARERRRSGIGAEVPFELVAHTDGRLTLMDPTTSRRVDLESFGPTNMQEFAQLLREPR